MADPAPLAMSALFTSTVGRFHLNWAAIDLHTDIAIYKLLKVTPQQAHLILGGMMFGPKARLLADLVYHSDAPNKSKIMGPFNVIRNSNRVLFTHSYFASDDLTLIFMERSVSGGQFKAKENRFSFRVSVACTKNWRICQ